MFILDPVLAKDTLHIASLPLCELLLMNDSNYPWFILVPRVQGLSEIIELDNDQLAQFWQESNKLSRMLKTDFSAEKLNIAALGNVVAQLHIHHIARFKHDVAWPQPVWGVVSAIPYTNLQIEMVKAITNLHYD
jgi:diadenosine tetraphosphate (Ap4A) HIT family hydrolase